MDIVDKSRMVQLLAGSELFCSLSEAELAQLASHASIRSVPARSTVFEKGACGNEMFAIYHGKVKISTLSTEGKEVIFALLESGDFFGETAILDGQPRSATCTTIEDCQMVVIERQRFLTYLSTTPGLAIHLLALLCQRLRATDEQLEDINFYSLTVRLARKLLTLAREYGQELEGRTVIAINLSQLELGSMVWSSRESVNKQLAQWVKSGMISLHAGMIGIEDHAQLLAISRLDPGSHTRRFSLLV